MSWDKDQDYRGDNINDDIMDPQQQGGVFQGNQGRDFNDDQFNPNYNSPGSLDRSAMDEGGYEEGGVGGIKDYVKDKIKSKIFGSRYNEGKRDFGEDEQGYREGGSGNRDDEY
ncbi:hypothetical protein FDP41_011726 [Naegleria fowleri]|uniref:Uncharacterized protein n=1 Tax=Naegleria fowleri TaxID=5763 RepID=A0A6A5C907_NAEFO|nr:uncharacterized protein FDP41_011726 [Naegleria fowleri]KAF0981865.1 hypothetical protein FDP41_011726 [Naegleria fowleri]CAG4711708.1 unnamed protein product [Naegleria fowleri]